VSALNVHERSLYPWLAVVASYRTFDINCPFRTIFRPIYMSSFPVIGVTCTVIFLFLQKLFTFDFNFKRHSSCLRVDILTCIFIDAMIVLQRSWGDICLRYILLPWFVYRCSSLARNKTIQCASVNQFHLYNNNHYWWQHHRDGRMICHTVEVSEWKGL